MVHSEVSLGSGETTHTVLNRHPGEPKPAVNKLDSSAYYDPSEGLHVLPVVPTTTVATSTRIPID